MKAFMRNLSREFRLGLLLAGLLSVGSWSWAQNSLPTDTPYTVIHRGNSFRVWEKTSYEQAPDGKVNVKKHQFTELADGLCYQNSAGQWVDSVETIDLQSDGSAAALQGTHQANFPPDIAQGAITLKITGGQTLTSRPLGICLDDGTQTVLIGEITDSTGELTAQNQVTYPNCFSGVQADLLYTYKKGGFEQDVVFHQQPPDPASFGLNPATTKLQVLTEYFRVPEPLIKDSGANGIDGDISLFFGTSIIAHGRAFLTSADATQAPSVEDSLSVTKRWQTIQGRRFLIEEVPLRQAEASLQSLPQTASAKTMPVNQLYAKASRTRRLPPAHPMLAGGTARIHLAVKRSQTQPEFVMDYVQIESSLNTLTLQGDTTYYIPSGQFINLCDTLTVEAGAVVKYDSESGIQTWGPIHFKTAPYRPAVFTSCYDNSVGQNLGLSGSPDYTFDAFSMNCGPQSFDNIRVCYSAYAFHGHDLTFNNCQIINCMNAICDEWWGGGGYYANLTNVLISNVQNPFLGKNYTVNACNVTIDGCDTLCEDWGGETETLHFVNSILVNITDWGSTGSVTTNCTVFVPDDSVFQTVGGAGYYLANGSPYRNCGTTNIDSATLADLATKTTWPPVVYADASLTTDLTLGPVVPRDTNSSLDLGYHYDALDYVVGGCDLYANLTLNPGTAVGLYEDGSSLDGPPYALSINDGAVFNSDGNATNPVWLVHTYNVQEYQNGNWQNTGWMGLLMINGSGDDGGPTVNAQFTKWADLAANANFFRDDWAYGVAVMNSCEFYSGGFSTYWGPQYFTNCLFFRSDDALWNQIGASDFSLINCTWYGGNLWMCRSSSQPCQWTIENSAFDGTAIAFGDSFYGSSSHTAMDHNAYAMSNLSWTNEAWIGTESWDSCAVSNVLENLGSSDVLVYSDVGFNWQAGWLGSFYLPPGSPLIQAGTTNANLLGLADFTTQASQTPEGSSPVDIGYHYWVLPSMTPVITLQPTNVVVAVGGTVQLSVAASGPGPLEYQWYFNGSPILVSNYLTTVAGNYDFAAFTDYAGDGDYATNAALQYPMGVAADSTGNLYIADTYNCVVRLVDTNGIISTFAGTDIVGDSWAPGQGYYGDGGPAAIAGLAYPQGVCVDGQGNLYIADTGNNVIRKVDTNGIIWTVVGNGSSGYSGDGGQATNANLSSPSSVAVDGMGDLYIADSGNNVVRMVDINGDISTVAGNGSGGYSGDGGPSTNATLSTPSSIALDGNGNLYIADTGNSVIRIVDLDGTISTVVGNGSNGYTGDGTNALSAELNNPEGVAVDGSGNIYVSDTGNNVVRLVSSAGTISTVGGTGSGGFNGYAGVANSLQLSSPMGGCIDSTVNYLFVDAGNSLVRSVAVANYTGTVSNGVLTVSGVGISQAGIYQAVVSNTHDSTNSLSVGVLVYQSEFGAGNTNILEVYTPLR